MHRVWQLPLIGLVFLVTACQQPQAVTPAPPPPKVTVSQPVSRRIVESDVYTGRLEAVESVDVRARVSGYLQSIHFADGAIVMTGRAVFSNPDLTLIPGLFARIRLPGSSQYQALLIPAVAEPRLPEEVRQIGVTTEKSSPDFLLVAHLLSPDNRYHQAYISNYALIRVRDVLARLDGVGDVTIFGAREYSMRIWLDPDKIAARNLTASDVVQALRQQNVQVAGGVIGQPPVPQSNAYQLSVNTLGRLTDVEQFGDIVVRTGEDRRITRLRDVARVEVGARDYASNSYLDGKPAQGIGIFQRPGSNALATAQAVRRTMADLSKQFPPGLEYRFVYDPTVFVQESMNAVFDTLLEASMLVFIVVLIFLQDWRATLLPMIDVPVALIGTLIVSMCLLSAIAGVWRRGMDNNILTQIGFVVLVALACKNAILIVEFAKEQQQAGKDRVAAAIEACRIRLRPILMTSFAFILGVVPLFVATGAGAEMLRALGTSVLSGMLGVTFFALLLTPVFYVVIRWFVERRREKPEPSLNHVGTLAIIALVPCLLLLSGRMLVGPDYKAPPLQAPAGFANKVGNQC